MAKLQPTPTPPAWADRLISRLCPPSLQEELLGDLHEQFARQVDEVGERQARRLYVLEVLKFIRPYFIKQRAASAYRRQPSASSHSFLLSPTMLRNYLKIAFRNLWRSKGYTAVNVVGLSVAFCICTFLFLTVYHSLSFDSFHEDSDRIFQTYFFSNDPEKADRNGNMPLPLTPALKADYPEIEAAARLISGKSLVTYKEKRVDKVITRTDADFLNIFSFRLTKGNKATALRDLSSIVITETMARAVFGQEDPLGKALQIGGDANKKQFIVTGILEDIPDNSSIHFDALVRIENFSRYQEDNDKWDSFSHPVFLKLASNVEEAAFEERLRPFIRKYFNENLKTLKKKGAKPDEQGDLFALRLQKLSDVHFSRELSGGGSGPIAVVYALLGISFFILFIACINFINLSIARSFTRAREVGVRKSLGALKNQLFVQIWGEAILVCFIGFLAGTLMAYLLVPEFNAIFGANLTLTYVLQPGVVALILGMFILVTFVAGGYPAWQMAKFNPVEVLKGKISLKRPGILRNSLLVTQFAMSSLLACCTIIAVQQVDHLREQPLGFQKEQVISIPVGTAADGRQVLQRLRNRLAGDPTVLAITGTGVNLGRGKDGVSSRSILGFTYKENEVSTDWLLVDYDYLKTLGVKILSGREFSPAYPTDSLNRVIISESMARKIGEKNPVGRFFQTDTAGTRYQIIGLVPDFQLYSATSEILPITMHLSNSEPINYIFVRVAAANLNTSMEKLAMIWQELVPGSEFTGSFMDENIDAWYKEEERLSQVFSLASGIAILLSCLGLFAVALMVIEQRTKEIGVRKVLGASIPNIILILSRDFVKLVFIALLIAIPLAWFFMQKWLDHYPYRIEISPWVFVSVGLAVVLTAVATVSFQSIRAALVNPVKSLRSE